MDGVLSWLLARLQSNEVAAVIIAALIAGATGLFRRGRLGWSISHQHNFLVPIQPPQGAAKLAQPALQTVYTRDIWVQNVGRGSITNIELVLNYPPQHYEIWPQREFQVVMNPDGRMVIKVASLGAREFFTVVMLSVAHELPLVTNVRSSDGVARAVTMGPQQIFSRPFVQLLRLMLFLGIAAAVYLVLLLAQWLSLLTKGS
ncbi:MAG: hypothetical protein WBQ82_00320 [Methyloceanibacter sp.]